MYYNCKYECTGVRLLLWKTYLILISIKSSFTVTCNTLEAIPKGSVALSTDGAMTSAHIVCAIGATVVGTTELRCQTNGSWDLPPPSCSMYKSDDIIVCIIVSKCQYSNNLFPERHCNRI